MSWSGFVDRIGPLSCTLYAAHRCPQENIGPGNISLSIRGQGQGQSADTYSVSTHMHVLCRRRGCKCQRVIRSMPQVIFS